MILALPHLGGWEWAGRWLATQGFRVTVVVEEIEPPELFEWFVRLRTDLGMNVVPLGPGAAAAIVKALNENQIVCLLSDRDIGGGGVEVEFFGERTTLPAGPATLSLRTGAPIVPVGVYFTRAPARASRRLPAAARHDSPGQAARGRRPGHPGPRPRARAPDPAGARAVAPLPAELAERPRLREKPQVDRESGRPRSPLPALLVEIKCDESDVGRSLADRRRHGEDRGSGRFAGIGRRRRRAVAIVAASRPDAYRGTRRRLSCPGVHKSRSAHACVLIWALVGWSRSR